MKADGLILLGYGDYVPYRSKLEKMVEQKTHFVRWGAVEAGQPGVSIGCDNFQGGRLAGLHLIDRGRKHVAFLGGASSHCPEFLDRYRGCDAPCAMRAWRWTRNCRWMPKPRRRPVTQRPLP
jgi:DNA-binding LacI/PurR family transcriptional regulator